MAKRSLCLAIQLTPLMAEDHNWSDSRLKFKSVCWPTLLLSSRNSAVCYLTEIMSPDERAGSRPDPNLWWISQERKQIESETVNGAVESPKCIARRGKTLNSRLVLKFKFIQIDRPMRSFIIRRERGKFRALGRLLALCDCICIRIIRPRDFPAKRIARETNASHMYEVQWNSIGNSKVLA